MNGSAAPVVRFVVPEGFDDPERVSGGNVYDRRLRDALRTGGIAVETVPLPVGRADALARSMTAAPTDSLVLVDGLLAVPGSAVLAAHATRLRIVVLAHMVASALPGAVAGTSRHEREALRAARRVIATSEWTRAELIGRGLADPERIAVARPGSDPVPPARGSAVGGHLLCLGVVAAHKGQDLLVEALAAMRDLPGWTCSIVGSTDAEPAFARRLVEAVQAAGLGDRVAFTGVLTGARLADAYDGADLVVAPSRAESYGMVVAEALARGIPVVAARVGGVPEAVDGSPAAVLVPPGDATALQQALRSWCRDADRRTVLKADALRSRGVPRSWDATAEAAVTALRATGPACVGALGSGRRGAA